MLKSEVLGNKFQILELSIIFQFVKGKSLTESLQICLFSFSFWDSLTQDNQKKMNRKIKDMTQKPAPRPYLKSAPRPYLKSAPSRKTVRSRHVGWTWSQHQTKKETKQYFLYILLCVVWAQDFWWWKKSTVNVFSFSFFVWFQRIDYDDASNRQVFALIPKVRQDNQNKMRQQENKGYDPGVSNQGSVWIPLITEN